MARVKAKSHPTSRSSSQSTPRPPTKKKRAPTGDKQTILVPEARRVSQEDITIRPVIDCRMHADQFLPRTPTGNTYPNELPYDPWCCLLLAFVLDRRRIDGAERGDFLGHLAWCSGGYVVGER